jgi:predicted nucleic acid-binding protein
VDVDNILLKVGTFLDDVTRGLDPELLGFLKKYTEENVTMFAGRQIEDLKVIMVVDTNVALQAIRYYAKGKTSILLKMAKNPMFPMYAPREMAGEVEEKIEIMAAEEGLEKGKMWEAWRIIRKVVKLTRARDALAYARAANMIGARDPDDVAFVQICIETGAAGILTNDEDFGVADVRTFSLMGLNRMVAMFHRGVYSFFVLHALLPRFVALLGKILFAIVREVFNVLSLLAELAAGAIAGAIERVAALVGKLPNSLKIAVGIGLLVIIIALVIEKSREKIISFFAWLWAKIQPILNALAEWLRHAANLIMQLAHSSGPYAFVAMAIATKFYENVREMTDELTKLSAAAA